MNPRADGARRVRMVDVMTFQEAIQDARTRYRHRSVLLGNGFSIDYNPTIFDYSALADEAALSRLSVDKEELFGSVNSRNFEVVMERLNTAATLQELYGGDRRLARKLRKDAKIVGRGLADVLAARHPDTALMLTREEVEHARAFLSHFRNLFTLSYDLLLYWVVNRPVGSVVPQKDGFEFPTRTDQSVLIWKVAPSTGNQRVFFLHGALHMFVREGRLEKLSYWNDGPLVEGLRARLDDGEYPLIVTEGTRLEKEARIDRSLYLRTNHRRFGILGGALFIHGVSMGENDDHILELIEAETSEIEAIYVGIHGDPNSPGARRLMARAEEIKVRRREGEGAPLRVRFYQSETANVWRDA